MNSLFQKKKEKIGANSTWTNEQCREAVNKIGEELWRQIINAKFCIVSLSKVCGRALSEVGTFATFASLRVFSTESFFTCA